MSVKIFLGTLVGLGLVYYVWDFFGKVAYGDKGSYRVASSTIDESVKRGMFIRELHFKIDSFSGTPFKFEAFIEKGFRYGRTTVHETVSLLNSSFPYQLGFNYRPNLATTVTIREDQLQKFDSANASWGYLKKPELPDTIILNINGENIHSGLIKVW